MASLGRIFSANTKDKIEVLYKDVTSSGILDPVGTSAYTLPDVTVDTASKAFSVFDLTAELDAKSQVKASILAPSAQIAPFDSSDPLTAPSGSSYGVLEVTGNLSSNETAEKDIAALTLSASGAASFTYDHYLLVAATAKRLDALTKVVASSELPQFAPLASLQAGEISRFQATLNLDLGLKATYGDTFDYDHALSLFDGLSAQIKASAKASIEASLGWTLYDDMDVVVGSAQQLQPGWVRVRIDRSRKDEFTAGATFALQATWDASSIATALEKAFQTSAFKRAIDVLTIVANGQWENIEQVIVDKTSQELIALIAGTGWKEKAASDPEVTKALADINKVVSIYNSIDAKVQQLWGNLLIKVDLEPGSELRKTIDTIAGLDPQDPNLEQFLSPTAQKDLQMLESLSGKSIEQLLIGSNAGVESAITKAVNLAKQLERVITDTPTEINSALATFAKNSGIQSIITWLATNATSLDQIQAFGDTEIKKIVSKAVGKTFDKISPQDLAAVQKWAQRITAEWTELSAKLAKAAKALQGSLGFNASLEISRITEYSAVLDFEVDPKNAAAVAAVEKELPQGNVRGMLVALDGLGNDDVRPFAIRESMIVSRHTRSSVSTVLLSFMKLSNLQTVTGSRFDESVVHISDSGRSATFSGGFTQAVSTSDTTSQCGVWVEADATDDQRDLSLPFDTVDRSLRLTFSRTQTKTAAAQLNALQTLLIDLGFFVTAAQSLTDAPANADTTFALDIRLDEAALTAFAQDDGETNWNKDYRNAAYRLLRDDLITDRIASLNESTGEVLAGVVKTDLFAQTWTDSSTTAFRSVLVNKSFSLGGKHLVVLDDDNRFVPPYVPIQTLITRRPKGYGALKGLRDALAASADRKPHSLTRLATAAAATFANTTLPEWDNPMFAFWFVVARLCRLNVLKTAVGLATLRYRTSSTAQLSDPMQWTLTKDVGVPVTQIKARQLFPFA